MLPEMDKETALKLTALDRAITVSINSDTVEVIITVAKKFEAYLKGDSNAQT